MPAAIAETSNGPERQVTDDPHRRRSDLSAGSEFRGASDTLPGDLGSGYESGDQGPDHATRRGRRRAVRIDRSRPSLLELLVNGAPKTQHISAVIGDLEGSESIARAGQFPMHRNPPAYELRVQRVRIVRAEVGVPASPFVTRMIRLWMDLGRDGLDHEHYPVASDDGPEVSFGSVTTTFVKNVETQLGLIERKRGAQVVDNK